MEDDYTIVTEENDALQYEKNSLEEKCSELQEEIDRLTEYDQ